ncbi:MAG: metalloregulator ArsR/SmtB family transcription factor [Halobacteriaceae archaeon]
MDSGALLDLLGNENRRRILRLLARKPCYVTEISEYLGVSPKAVIDHLRKLEEAGLVESRVDDGRRKYFHIVRNLRLEVNVSPYGFGTKSAYPASADLDLTRCSYVSIDVDATGGGDVGDLASELERLQDLERELSLAQRWVQGRIADVQDRLREHVATDDNDYLHTEVVTAVANGADTADDVATRLDAPREVVERTLARLSERGLVERTAEGWTLS